MTAAALKCAATLRKEVLTTESSLVGAEHGRRAATTKQKQVSDFK